MADETKSRQLHEAEIGEEFTVSFKVAREFDPINFGAFISKIEKVGEEMGFEIVL